MRSYRLEFTDKNGANCVTRFEALNRYEAIGIAIENYGAEKIIGCWHIDIQAVEIKSPTSTINAS